MLRDNLSIEAIAEACCKIMESSELELDELSHIVVKGTNIRVGYIADESLQFCDYPSNQLKKYHDYIVEKVLPSVDYITDEQADRDDS